MTTKHGGHSLRPAEPLDMAIHPAETLNELLEERSLDPAEFAQRHGFGLDLFARLRAGQADVTSELAEKLELALGVPARLWLALQADHDRVVKR